MYCLNVELTLKSWKNGNRCTRSISSNAIHKTVNSIWTGSRYKDFINPYLTYNNLWSNQVLILNVNCLCAFMDQYLITTFVPFLPCIWHNSNSKNELQLNIFLSDKYSSDINTILKISNKTAKNNKIVHFLFLSNFLIARYLKGS